MSLFQSNLLPGNVEAQHKPAPHALNLNSRKTLVTPRRASLTMTLSQQHIFHSPQTNGPQRQDSAYEGFPGYSVQPHNLPSMPATYGQYAMASPHQGAYQMTTPTEPGWISTVLLEIKDLLLLVNSKGRIIYASPSSKQITGRVAKQLEGIVLAQLIHNDDKMIFNREMDDAMGMNRTFRTHVRLQRTNSTYTLVEIYGHPHMDNSTQSQPRANSPQEQHCVGFFLMCRPHISKNTQLLDSFLEHKIENARLVQQIAKLKQEEEEEANSNRVPFPKPDPERSYLDNQTAMQGIPSDQDSSETAAPNSDDSEASPPPESFSDSMPQYGELTHIEGIEVMTGLHYANGERSQGLSVGAARGRLIHCDIDITTTADQARSAQEGDRRKRLKGQHVCSDCGTADSPEWRKGPNGPKTLCNACGCEFLFLVLVAFLSFFYCPRLSLSLAFHIANSNFL